MKLHNNAQLLAATVLTLFCAVACNRAPDREYSRESVATTSSTDTVSNTTFAPRDTTSSVSPAPEKKMKKHTKKTHETSALAPLPAEPVVTNDDDSYFYDSDLMADDSMIGSRDNSLDASRDFIEEETVSGTTLAPMDVRETGLSPFAQEPNSRTPAQIGSGQLTGEDKSTTILDRASLFQDPSALGRDLIR